VRLKPYSYQKFPFSKLFQAYADNFSQVADFYETNPSNSDEFPQRADSLKFDGNRKKLSALLRQFNEPFSPDNAVFANIKRFENSRALAIVTGQQLGIYGGPVYTFFKTLTAVHLARALEKKLERPVIPVFWLADEDHDYEEVRSLFVPGKGGGVDKISLPDAKKKLPPVSDILLPEEIKTFRSNIRSTLIETDFTADLWELLDGCFYPGASFRSAFGRFMTKLFSKYGLVLAGSHDKSIKNHLKKTLILSVQHADEIRQKLDYQSQKIGQKFHQQAAANASHLFYLHPDTSERLKIQRRDGQWETGAGQAWSSHDLIREIDIDPEHFSPDVFLRPILQDNLLPVLGYVAGPGEIAYYGQMKPFYQVFRQEMPIIFPRLSGTFIEPAIDRIMSELPFDIDAYQQRIEDLESSFAEQAGELDIETIFVRWKQEEQATASKHIQKIAGLDETLEGAAKHAQSSYFNELNKLKGKVYKAVKKRKSIQLNRIHRIQQNLFPERQLQERLYCGVYYMNKFGVDIWDRLLGEMAEINLDKHQLVYL
jgi:bacillithiol biosynthesis cysteine-adding enzyme BshC